MPTVAPRPAGHRSTAHFRSPGAAGARLADDRRRNGLFVLTGSAQFLLFDKVDQSLAGRTALLHLLPLSIEELRAGGMKPEVDEMLFAGFFPRIHDQGLDPTIALGDYVETYLERDIRRIGEIRNLSAFRGRGAAGGDVRSAHPFRFGGIGTGGVSGIARCVVPRPSGGVGLRRARCRALHVPACRAPAGRTGRPCRSLPQEVL